MNKSLVTPEHLLKEILDLKQEIRELKERQPLVITQPMPHVCPHVCPQPYQPIQPFSPWYQQPYYYNTLNQQFSSIGGSIING